MTMLSKENSHPVSHIILHTGDKPYRCHKCDKASKENNHIVSNIIIQTRDRSYHCCHVNKKSFHI